MVSNNDNNFETTEVYEVEINPHEIGLLLSELSGISGLKTKVIHGDTNEEICENEQNTTVEDVLEDIANYELSYDNNNDNTNLEYKLDQDFIIQDYSRDDNEIASSDHELDIKVEEIEEDVKPVIIPILKQPTEGKFYSKIEISQHFCTSSSICDFIYLKLHSFFRNV